MSYFEKTNIQASDSPSIDAFGRWRVSNPQTLFDSKNIFDDDGLDADVENQPLFYDNVETSGTGTTTTWLPNEASQKLTVAAETAGTRVRQTKMRFNYQPGKALRVGEPVLTGAGFVKIEDIKVGEKVFDGLGQLVNVVGTKRWENRKVYRVTFDDGTFVDADEQHDWKVIIRQNSKKGEHRKLSTLDMLNEYGNRPPQFARWRIPASPVLDIQRKEVGIDPYTLGCVLGDGYIGTGGFVHFTSADKEIVENMTNITEHSGLYDYGVAGLQDEFNKYGLAGKTSYFKFIPKDYLFNDKDIRLAVLRGLMDTDGDVDKRVGTAQFTSTSKQLAEDVAFLVRSIGGQAKIKEKECHYLDDDGARVQCHIAYRVSVISPICPFKLGRKAFYWKPRTRISFDRYIHSIDYLGEFDTVCIEVDSKDHTFLTRNNVVTHNSQMVLMTFNMLGAVANITKREGIFDDSNGLFLELAGETVNLVRRTYTSGSAVDTAVAQANWNVDKMNGTGVSGVTLDFTKTQILFIDFEWLGVGRVRMGFVIDGIIYYAHEFLNANSLTVPYMTTPNLPLRSEISNDGSGVESSIVQVCSSVISEGGSEDLGVTRYASTAGTHVDANTENTLYAVIGIKLKAEYLGATVKILNTVLQIHTASEKCEWVLLYNPTVADTFTYSDQTNSAVQIAIGATANTVTNGIAIAGGFIESGGVAGGSAGSSDKGIDSALRLGSTVAGVPDAIVLCIRPIAGSADVDVEGSLTWRELV